MSSRTIIAQIRTGSGPAGRDSSDHTAPGRCWLALVGMLLCALAPFADAQVDVEFENAVDALTTRSFKDKQQAVTRLAAVANPRTVTVLQAMLDGRLYYYKEDQRVVTVEPSPEGFRTTDAISGEPIGTARKRQLKRVSTNNKLRKLLRGELARLSLSHPDADVRIAAVREISGSIDEDTRALLRELVDREADAGVAEAMREALALADLGGDDRALRLAAIEQLLGSTTRVVRNRLSELVASDAQGNWIEQDESIREAAAGALRNIDSKLATFRFAENLFFGLSAGSVLLLAAIGLAITFGVMGVINMAHGELIMIGAYTTYVVQLLMPNHLDLSLFVAIPAAFLVAGLFGVAIERGVIQFLYGRPLETLLATFGISLILQQLVRTVFSPLNRSVVTPVWMSGSVQLDPALSLTLNRLYIVLFSVLVFAVLLVVLKHTSLGLKVRAVTQNREMARAMGIRTPWVDAMTFGLGSGIAGVAGVALSQLTNVGPNLGQSYIIDSFMVVVFGGVGNLWGTLVGSMSLGVVNKFLEPYSGAVLAKILILVLIIVFIQKRPRGLFPQTGRAADK